MKRELVFRLTESMNEIFDSVKNLVTKVFAPLCLNFSSTYAISMGLFYAHGNILAGILSENVHGEFCELRQKYINDVEALVAKDISIFANMNVDAEQN